MKHLKKMLVVLIAVMMIVSMSAVAFADATYTLTAGDADEDGYVPFTMTLKNGAGMKSDDLILRYDAEKMTYAWCDDGADTEKMGDVKGNSIMLKDNGNTAGEIQFSFLFEEELSSEYLKDKKQKPVDIDPNNFEVVVFWFEVSEDAASISLSVSKKGETAVISQAEKTLKEETPTEAPTEKPTEAPTEKPTEAPTEKPTEAPTEEPTEAPTEEPTKEEPAKEEPTKAEETPTKKPQQVDGGVNTGDNMALAAAFGVAMLAGAAFVLTKKRK